MTPEDHQNDDPCEICLRCSGVGCDFCAGAGEVPYGTYEIEHLIGVVDFASGVFSLVPDEEDDSQPDYGLEKVEEIEDDAHSTSLCDYCEGTGTVQDGYYGIGSNLYPCGVCKGTGRR